MALQRKEKSWEEAILEVLREGQKPMRYNEIANRIVELDLRCGKVGATPAITVNAYLRNKLAGQVEPLGRGIYCLKDLSYTKEAFAGQFSDAVEETDLQGDMITAFGRFWKRSVFESNRCSLLGRNMEAKDALPVDFTKFDGIYMLHQGYQVVYVGQAEELSKRLSDHLKDDKRGRWNCFSWFSIRDIEDTNDSPIKKTLDGKSLLDTIEALLIEVLGPERNRKNGNNFADKEFEQLTLNDYYQSLVTYNNK